MIECCTMLDGRFLPRLVALHASIVSKTPVTMWALCADDEAFDALQKLALPGVTSIRFSALEKHFPELTSVKTTRSPYEYLMTCKPFLLRYLLETQANIDLLCYMDGDLFFFGDPSVIAHEGRDVSVLLSPHRFPEHAKKGDVHGRYNAGFVALRNDETGHAVARWWSERTAEWCLDRVEDGKFIDQKYLDHVPEKFKNVRLLEHPGCNLAPWNIARHRLSSKNGSITVDDRPLVFYHFHALRLLSPRILDLGIAPYRVAGNGVLFSSIYRPYVRALADARAVLANVGYDIPPFKTVRATERQPITPGLLASRVRRRQWAIFLGNKLL